MTDREIFVSIVERVAGDPAARTVRVSAAELEALERVAESLPAKLGSSKDGRKDFMGRVIEVAP